jgi:hypothetical protein
LRDRLLDALGFHADYEYWSVFGTHFETPSMARLKTVFEIAEHPNRGLPSGVVVKEVFPNLIPMCAVTVDMEKIARHARTTSKVLGRSV